MPRLYCPLPLQTGQEILLPSSLARHVQVLRLQVGDELLLFNGEGGEHLAQVQEIGKRDCRVLLRHFSPREVELPYAVTIAQALPEGSKMDWIVEKCVELGVACIQPLQAQRSVVKLSAERAEKRVQHWQGIVAAASEQSGRNRLAHVNAPLEFGAWAERSDLHKRVLLSPRASQSLADWAAHHSPQALAIAVGPEGGFSEREEELALQHGLLPLAMGARVLRTETAALAAMATLAAHWDR